MVVAAQPVARGINETDKKKRPENPAAKAYLN